MLKCFVVADETMPDHVQWSKMWYGRLRDNLKTTNAEWDISEFSIRRCALDDPDHQADVALAFQSLCEGLERAVLGDNSSDRYIGIVDARKYEDIDAIQSLTSVQGLLILSFPEVLWLPSVGRGDSLETESDSWLSLPRAINLSLGGYTPLFDGTGLRSHLIERRETSSLKYSRKDVCLAIDEEKDFSLFNSYVAFRFGYRAYPIMTWRVANEILNKDRTCLPVVSGCEIDDDATVVAFEDAFVEFIDGTREVNKAHAIGDKRDRAWPLLSGADYRILTTAAEPSEKIVETESADHVRIKTYFSTAKAAVSDVSSGLLGWSCKLKERYKRMIFNLLAGGWMGVWLWNLVVASVVGFALIGCLFSCPILFIPAIFIVFILLGVAQSGLSSLLAKIVGRDSVLSRWLDIRSQWRYFPRMYEFHCPQIQIHKHLRPYWCMVKKPVSGVFGLRNECGLPNGRSFAGFMTARGVRAVYRHAVEGAVPTETGYVLPNSNHASPGMALAVATSLIRRAERMKGSVTDVEGAIHAAVLATCAYELLGHKTPAVSIEALALRHYFEVEAECEFPGIRAKFDMKDRYTDFHNSMWQICRTSQGRVRESLFASGMAEICDTLASLLHEHGKHEEAAFFSRRSRHMHRLMLPNVMRSLLAFPEWCVRSKINFATSLVFTVLLFVLYAHMVIDPSWDGADLFKNAYLMLFSTQPDMTLERLKDNPALLTTATVVVQVMRQLMLIHVGFLAALFYDFMHRK